MISQSSVLKLRIPAFCFSIAWCVFLKAGEGLFEGSSPNAIPSNMFLLAGLSNPDLELPLAQVGMFSCGEALSGNHDRHQQSHETSPLSVICGVTDDRAASLLTESLIKFRKGKVQEHSRGPDLEIKHLLNSRK